MRSRVAMPTKCFNAEINAVREVSATQVCLSPVVSLLPRQSKCLLRSAPIAAAADPRPPSPMDVPQAALRPALACAVCHELPRDAVRCMSKDCKRIFCEHCAHSVASANAPCALLFTFAFVFALLSKLLYWCICSAPKDAYTISLKHTEAENIQITQSTRYTVYPMRFNTRVIITY